jgi:hypothetical protein
MRTGDVGIRAQIQRSQTCADDTASGVSLWVGQSRLWTAGRGALAGSARAGGYLGVVWGLEVGSGRQMSATGSGLACHTSFWWGSA